MLLVIDLNENEQIDLDIYKAIEYIWLDADCVTQYDNIEEFVKHKKFHISKSGESLVAIIDTDTKNYKVFDVKENYDNEW